MSERRQRYRIWNEHGKSTHVFATSFLQHIWNECCLTGLSEETVKRVREELGDGFLYCDATRYSPKLHLMEDTRAQRF